MRYTVAGAIAIAFAVNVAAFPKSLIFTNNCDRPVKLMVLYADPGGDWKMEGWWPFEGGASANLTDASGKVLKSNHTNFYYYAEATDGSGYYWGGDEERTFEGRQIKLVRHSARSDAKFLDFAVGCGAEPEKGDKGEVEPSVDGSNAVKKVEVEQFKGGFIEVEALFNQSGMLEVYSRSVAKTREAKGQFIVIGRDEMGNALLVSGIFDAPTACAPPDSAAKKTSTCPSDVKAKDWENFHHGYVGEVVALHIYIRENSPKDYAGIITKEIERQCKTNLEMSKALRAAIAAKYGFPSCFAR